MQTGSVYMTECLFSELYLAARDVWQSLPVFRLIRRTDFDQFCICVVCMPAKQQFLLYKKWEYLLCDNASIELVI